MSSDKSHLTSADRALREVFMRLATAADEFEGYRHPHAERVAKLADELARLFGLGRADRAALYLAALGHDLGEAAMKRDYIKRQGALSEDERLDLLRHPVIGEQEVAHAGGDRGAQLLVRWHHEWWNGAGYPDALRREQIPLAARLLRVADAYAALTDTRPYRAALSETDARRHLTEWAGLEFDPQAVRAFLTLRDLPELRSYALLERAPAVEPNVSETTTTANRHESDLIGHVPEAGVNPHASVGAPEATSDLPADEVSQFDNATR
jgi:HD-GYP domain-containing protein (c-di-GMP phosphodiesterase class II)